MQCGSHGRLRSAPRQSSPCGCINPPARTRRRRHGAHPRADARTLPPCPPSAAASHHKLGGSVPATATNLETTMLRLTTRGRGVRTAAALAIASVTAAGMAACSTSGAPAAGGGGGSGGSATSGTVNWWGWSPSTQDAGTYIAAFNKVYPNIKVNYKLLP